MRVSGSWLEAPATQSVFAALTAADHVAFAVGGCVRNAVMGVPVSDVDIATDATPETVIRLAEAANIKSVPTGIDHGTVTLVLDNTGYEVTTFRADMETDGRRAVVRYSTDMAEDAARRDFTMNALYADADGLVHDPLNGLPDLEERRVRFIGDAHARIAEDYLRILRFFRFAAWYGDPELGFDAEALSAIAASLEGLGGLSRERVTAELVKLLGSDDPAPAVATMQQTGVLPTILPGSDPKALALLVHLETLHEIPPEPIRRLASLGVFDSRNLRLSKKTQKRLELYQSLISTPEAAAELAYRHGADVAVDVLLLRAAMVGMPMDSHMKDAIAEGAAARFPVKPSDLMPEFTGPALGDRLSELEKRWIASGFTLTKAELLD